MVRAQIHQADQSHFAGMRVELFIAIVREASLTGSVGQHTRQELTHMLDRDTGASIAEHQHERATRAELVRPAMLVGAALVVYLGIAAIIGRFPATDEVFFKSAGRQWAAGAGFGAPELTGALGDVSPPVTEVFFMHPPTYPFLFGVWTRLCGFGPHQCILFDALIHALLAGLTFAVAWRTFASLGGARGWLAAGCAIAILPLGTLARPDEIAMCLSLICWFLLLTPTLRSAHLLLAGLALGVCLGPSTGAAAATGFVALTLLLFKMGTRGGFPNPPAMGSGGGPASTRRVFKMSDGWLKLVTRGLLMGAGALLGVSISLGPLLAAHPNAPHQYVVHAQFLLKKISILTAWQEARPHATKYYTFLFGTFLSGLLAAALGGSRKAWRVWATYGFGASLFLLFLATFLALRATYTWFIGPWLLLAAAHSMFVLARTSGRRMRVVAPALLLVGGYCTFAVHFVKESVVIAKLPPAQRMDAASALLAESDPGRCLGVDQRRVVVHCRTEQDVRTDVFAPACRLDRIRRALRQRQRRAGKAGRAGCRDLGPVVHESDGRGCQRSSPATHARPGRSLDQQRVRLRIRCLPNDAG